MTKTEYEKEKAHHKRGADIILSFLREARGEWVDRLYQRTGVMVHSRVADLRRDGHCIECRRFGQGDYRYRLVEAQ